MATLKVEIKRKCAICGNVFLAKFLDSRYCSPKCQKIASARKKAEERRLQRLDELYSMSQKRFERLAKEADACYKMDRMVLVNIDRVDEYLESFRIVCNY